MSSRVDVCSVVQKGAVGLWGAFGGSYPAEYLLWSHGVVTTGLVCLYQAHNHRAEYINAHLAEISEQGVRKRCFQ